MTVHQVIAEIGKTEIMAALGVSESSVKEARRTGRFPASWFDTMDRLGADRGVTIPRDLFNWRASA